MKKRIVIGVIILIVAVLGIWWFVASRTKPSVPTVKATLGDVTSSVMVTGTTTPTQSVDLSFEQTGNAR